MHLTWQLRRGRGCALVAVAPHVRIYSPFTIEADVEGLAVEVDVAAVEPEGERAGRLVCVELRVRQREGGPAVTGEALRSVPVAYLTQVAARQMARTDAPDVLGGVTGPFPMVGTVPGQLAELAAQGPTEEVLATAAYLYRLSVVIGYGPRSAIEETFGVSRSTAGRWIALARERGHLGPVEGPGRAGG